MLFNSVFTIFRDFNIQCRVCYTACSVNRRETVSLFKFPIKSLMIPFELNWPVSLITIYILYVIITQAISWIHIHLDHARWNDSPQCAEGISKPWVVYASVIASTIHCDRLSSDTARPFAHHHSTQKLDRLPKTAWTVNVKSQKHWRGKLQSGRPHSVRAMI